MLTMKMHRLQAISIAEGILREPFGLCSILVEIAGGNVKQEQAKATMLCPLLSKKALPAFFKEIFC